MTKTAVVYHSGYGHTEVVAQAVQRGAAQIGDAVLIKVGPDGAIAESDWEHLNAADAIIFGAPTYMGSLSGPFKMFMDATSKIWFGGGWKDKIAGGFTNSASFSGDKLSSLIQLAVISAQHGMIWVGQSEMPAQPSVPHQRDPNSVNRIGSFLGLMTQAENDAPNVTPPAGDLKTAEIYGARVANAAKRWNK